MAKERRRRPPTTNTSAVIEAPVVKRQAQTSGNVHVGAQRIISFGVQVPGEKAARIVSLLPGRVNSVKADVWAALLAKRKSPIHEYMRSDIGIVWVMSDAEARRIVDMNGHPVDSPVPGAGENTFVPQDPLEAVEQRGIQLSQAERQAAQAAVDGALAQSSGVKPPPVAISG